MELYEELQRNHELFSSRNEEKDWFKLERLPVLNSVVLAKPFQATYATIDILEPEPDVTVYNLMLYSEDGNNVGGAEITNTYILWD
jgi:hypothetical protein